MTERRFRVTDSSKTDAEGAEKFSREQLEKDVAKARKQEFAEILEIEKRAAEADPFVPDLLGLLKAFSVTLSPDFVPDGVTFANWQERRSFRQLQKRRVAESSKAIKVAVRVVSLARRIQTLEP